ncbi:putative transcription activator of gluconeogenesis ERT1 [Rosellinia necatrix]|uniref:Putative transcription activator of gluconeogenesis ERT1 n=1 Tax=Rosellinia necatrix TaxID=77044 RepID=A0A1W2TED5_ROSNE|nr:putative transcription activator of gluconeogenesis ERT1 [Rosellinia necatrix]
MQILNRGVEQLFIPLSQRRGRSDQAASALDLTWARAEEKECALRGTRAYPSPPMSGSPPRPLKPNQEVAERGQGGFQASTHDAYRAGPAISGVEYRAATQPPLPPPPPPPLTAGRPYALETPERAPYSYRRPEDTIGRPVAYSHPQGQMIPQSQYSLPPVAGPGLGPVSYSMPINPPGSDNPPFTSPKSQRKTKGHVASACVPCKRAHLRCDAQRPCSRCLSNGKEDACIDVQHKKRGRPRLRDDREPRFDTGRFAHPPEPTIRRPLSLYTPSSAPPIPFDDPLRRSQSYRVLKSQPSEGVTPRFIERGSATDVNVFPAPLAITTQTPEPVAFLTIGDLEVVKASSTFIDATMSNTQSMLGYRSQPIVGRKLVDMITPPERDRVVALCKALQNEQLTKEPNYLPPIYGKDEEERVIKSQPFGPESVSRYQLDRQEFFTFVAADGQPRPHAVRFGLAKHDSIYFVVLLLTSPGRYFPHPSPSPRSRDVTYSYQPQPFTQLTPVSASFDPGRSRLTDPPRESGFTPRQPETPAQLVSTLSPGISPNVPSYAASASAPVRSDHPGGLTHQIPRSELTRAQSSQQAEYQLPPIRSQRQSVAPGDAIWQRDDRTSRVDIGGLIEQPGASPRRNP